MSLPALSVSPGRRTRGVEVNDADIHPSGEKGRDCRSQGPRSWVKARRTPRPEPASDGSCREKPLDLAGSSTTKDVSGDFSFFVGAPAIRDSDSAQLFVPGRRRY